MATKTIYVTAVNSTNAAHLTGGTAKIHFGYGYQSSYTVGYDGPLIENMPIVVDDSNPLVRVMMEIHKTGFWTPALIPPNLSPVNTNISTAIADPVEQNLPVDPVQSSSPTVTLTGHVQNAAGDPLPNRRLKVMAIPFSEYTLSGYDESFKSYLTATTDSSGNLTLVVPRPALTALGPMNYYLYVADDDPDYWTYRPSTSFVSPASPASLSFNTLELRSYDGDNVAVLSVPQFKDALPGDSNRQVTVYRSDMYQVHPSVDVPDGVTEVVVDKLGAGPYIVEFFLNVPGHDWDGWWPHIDEENDPDAWYNTKATQFTLSPGRNDLGTFHFADYPATCTRTFPKKEAKLRKVGFSQKAAALLTSNASVPNCSVVDSTPPGSPFSRKTMTCHSIGEAIAELVYVLPDGSSMYVDQLDYSDFVVGQSFTCTSWDQNGGIYGVIQTAAEWPGAVPGQWVGWTAGFAGHTSSLPWASASVALSPSFKDLLRVGFSPRQARTWLRVKGMEVPASAFYYDDVAGVYALVTQTAFAPNAHLLVHSSRVGGNWEFDTVESADGIVDASTALSDAAHTRATWHIPTDGSYYGFVGLGAPTQSGGLDAALIPGRAPSGDPRLDALIRGGFTTAQARLLLETL